ncbi:four-carbon acid sugar kinase family protein [Corticibacterium sp. UT-5YL-CI-8]|nr:four-carbon acid sugar kinase family protein [Tianweitania sp. UT-5YL-CI-8]
MLLGAIADDFTGASDLANTLAKEGMATTLFVGANDKAGDCEAGVVALKTRSIQAADAVAQSLDAARWLMDQGCRQFLFKYCSTFDSTPRGNIGPVTEALLDFLGTNIAIVCPAFPATGRRIFMSHLFVGDRLLNESGMQHHPLTPMTDPDLRRFLRLQTKGEVGAIHLDTVRSGPEALSAAFAAECQAGHRMVVADAIDDSDLRRIGTVAADHRLITGGSGIAIGLPQNFRDRNLLRAEAQPLPVPSGRGAVLCGSCSSMSQKQVADYSRDNPHYALDTGALMAGTLTVSEVAGWVLRNNGANPLVYSTADPGTVSNAQAAFGREKVAATIERFFGEVAQALVDGGVRRLVVGGGETSGAVVEALAVRSLRIGAEIDPGVPALVAERNGPLGLALKSGNFGAVDFFAKALQQVGTA